MRLIGNPPPRDVVDGEDPAIVHRVPARPRGRVDARLHGEATAHGGRLIQPILRDAK